MISNSRLELAYKFVESTNKNVFLTGKAGTGKTTFLQNLKTISSKRCVVVAPTGVAAINAGGVTIHSFFQMPFGPFIPGGKKPANAENPAGYTRMSRTKIKIIRSLDLLIIDEISMVRADLLDGMDEVLRRYRRTTKPFGGVQLLMIGDIRQLSPVVRDEDRQLLSPYYTTFYFYGSQALQRTDYISIELTEVFRQTDQKFIDILNSIRDKQSDPGKLKTLNTRYIPGFEAEEGYILLTTHNHKAKDINEKRLQALESEMFSREAAVDGEFPEYIYPTEYDLSLKEGAQVMFIKNDPSPEKQFYNGKIGRIEKIDTEDELIYVRCEEDNEEVVVERLKWHNCKYTLNPDTKEIEEEIIGSFTQFPLKLAWAITIHKSQGLTFDKAIIDAQESFAHGQVYVALSRCRSLEGLVLRSPISLTSIKTDPGVSQFSKEVEQNQPDSGILEKAADEFKKELILELFDFSSVRRATEQVLKEFRKSRASLIVNSESLAETMLSDLRKTIEKVSDKFILQLNRIFTENTPARETLLQERIIKGTAYFEEHFNRIFRDNVKKISIETDNRQVQKILKNRMEVLHHEVRVKQACLDSCKEGFVLNKYLDARAKASVEEIRVKKQAVNEVPLTMQDISHPGLFERLRQWRNNLAAEQDLPAYRIMSQRALMGISAALPTSTPEFLLIKGIGKRTLEKYGEEVLEIIETYCAENNIEHTFSPDIKITGSLKKVVPDTKNLSLELFEQGKNIEEIAAERGMSPLTIEGHLAFQIGEGKIDIKHFMADDQLAEIEDAIRKTGELHLAPLREALNEKYDYRQLKMAVAWYRYKNEKSKN